MSPVRTGGEALPLPCIMGPTGGGKTAVSLALAESFAISVINADSRQVYRDFPIITAQPAKAEQERCPHLLYGYLPLQEAIGAGVYARAAADAVAAVREEGRLPVLVGGTGLYFRALLDGMAPIPPTPPDICRKWRDRCEAEGSTVLHALLGEKDPEYAAKIHPNDKQRVSRALEVLEATGRTLTWWHRRELPPRPYRPCKIGIGLSLPELERHLALRIESMLQAGALEEGRKAMDRCADPAAPGWTGIGCAEVFLHLSGRISLDECRALWLKNTRAYAKRQFTWFRADPGIRWFAPGREKDVLEYVRGCLSASFFR